MHVTELAKAMEIAPDTIRYYRKIGLLRPARYPENKYHARNSSVGDRLKWV